MKVAVMGAGAVGGYYGGVLARDGVDVTLICRGAQRDAIRSAGLRVDSHWRQFTVNPFATDDPGEVGPVDLVLHCVKLYSNDEAVPLLRPLVGDETNILTIQNGVTSGQRLADEFGWDRVLQGATYIEAAIAARGTLSRPDPPRASSLANAMERRAIVRRRSGPCLTGLASRSR